MRFANQIWNTYRDNPILQDISETLIGSGIAAGGQLIFTDMDPGEIATSTAIGAALSMGARPVGTSIGRRIGAGIDKAKPDALNGISKYFPVTKEGFERSKQGLEALGASPDIKKGTEELLQAKRNYHAIRPDGTERGNAETLLSYYGNTRADNFAQYGFAALSPLIYGEDVTNEESLDSTLKI